MWAKFLKPLFIKPSIFISITKGYLRVQKVMKIKYFDYLLMCKPVKFHRVYIWAKFMEIWVNLVKFSRLGSIHPPPPPYLEHLQQGVIQCPGNDDKYHI